MTAPKNRLVIFSGPSCVGKSPLAKALALFHPTINASMQSLTLYNSRAARPGEIDGIDYQFRTREAIQELKNRKQFVIMEVRGDLQALDIKELQENLSRGDVLFEGNPFIGKELITHPGLARFKRLSIFMSPLSGEEIRSLKAVRPAPDLPELVTDVMRRKLLRRTKKQKGKLSLPDLQDIERRASSAYTELKDAFLFEHVIPNHDGEDSDNWNAFYYPLGDARKALAAFVSLVNGERPSFAEKWEKDLLP